MIVAFTVSDFTNGGYVAAVAALHEDSRFSLTLPTLEDWFYKLFMLINL